MLANFGSSSSQAFRQRPIRLIDLLHRWEIKDFPETPFAAVVATGADVYNGSFHPDTVRQPRAWYIHTSLHSKALLTMAAALYLHWRVQM